MCLAKAYVRAADTTSGAEGAGGRETAGAQDPGRLLMENVTQVQADGGRLRLRSLLGEVESLEGRIVSIDFAEARLVLESTPV
jgi:predicted RNA-binding protein